MTNRIFRAIVLVAGVVLFAAFAIITGVLYNYFATVQESQLKDEMELAAAAVEGYGMAYLDKLEPKHYRITWIEPNGRVLYDSQNDASVMESHADREEILEAIKSGEGESIRYSATRLETTIYSAKRLADGSVLRISVSRASAGGLVFDMIKPIITVLAVALILSFILAKRLSKKLVGPLNNIDLDRPLENDTYEELSPLLGRLNHQQQAIAASLQQLQHQKDEFAKIIENMKEGLVVFDRRGLIVSINPTACRLFSTDESCIGNNFITIERNRELGLAVENALVSGGSMLKMERMGRIYRFAITDIESAGEKIGAVLLVTDVSEQELLERSRREFTANVSHELKTPLQSIIGSAELIQNGIVKAEDMPRFIGHIKNEAARLVVLIQDIIRLSQLDEGVSMPTENVELLSLCEEVIVNLNDAATKKRIHAEVSGDAVSITGVRRLLYEVIYNLCDNAIKYTQLNGKVEITVSETDNIARIIVADTGIGIPDEHKKRVFERFYRVDKSHSKTSGGTGLGLSIVKHAVAYHKGTVELRNAPIVGTEVIVELPKTITDDAAK